jgi:hypothetical protein
MKEAILYKQLKLETLLGLWIYEAHYQLLLPAHLLLPVHFPSL